MTEEKKPRITIMGEDVTDQFPDAQQPPELADYFKPVKLSGRAIDSCSKIVPQEHYKLEGLHTWLQKRADHVFSKLASNATEGRLRSLKYFFEFDADGPVLKNVSL